MIEHIVKSEEDKLYRSPSTKVIPINVGVCCAIAKAMRDCMKKTSETEDSID